MPLVSTYDWDLVASSVAIAILAAAAALDLAGRVRATRGWIGAAWLVGGAAAMGLGIWCMHYTGMMAYGLPTEVRYHVPTVLVSLLAAILASGVALYVASREQMGIDRVILGSLAMGSGIAAMHYIGIAAMRVRALPTWNVALVVTSIGIALVVSAVALWFAFHHGQAVREGWTRRKIGSAVLMGLAIPAMHYTGMAAATFVASSEAVDYANTVGMTEYGVDAIAVGTLFVLLMGNAASYVSRYSEDRLRGSQAGYQSLARQLAEAQSIAHVGSFEWDIRTNVVTWSDELRRMFGLSPDAPAGYREFLAIAHSDDRPRLEALVAECVRTHQTVDYEWRVVRPDGDVRYMQARNVVIADATGEAIRMAGTSLDITDRKRTEEALAQSERYHRALTEQALDLTTLVDADGFVRYASPSYHSVLGYQPEQVIGQRVFDFVHPDDLDATLSIFTDGSTTPQATRTHEFRFRHHDGSWRVIAAVGRNLFDDPVIHAAIINGRDVTDQKLAAEHERTLLAELQRAISEVRVLHGILPICASCKRIRAEDGSWEAVESYVREHTNAEFTHGLCPDCAEKTWG